MKLFDIFLAFLMCLLWSSNYIVTKELLYTVPPIFLAALEFSVIALCLVPFFKRMPPNFFMLFVIALFLVVGHHGFADIGIKLNNSVTVANLILECAVITSVIFAAIFLKEKITRKIVLGIIIAFSGMILVVLGNAFDFISIDCNLVYTNNLLSMGALIAAVFSWSFYIVSTKKLGKELSALEVIGWLALIGCIQAFIVSAIFEENQMNVIRELDIKNIVLILFVAVLGTLVTNKIMYYLLKSHSVTRVSLIYLLVPFFTAVESYLIFDEQLTPSVALGGVLILAGIYITARSKAKEEVGKNDDDSNPELVVHSGCGVCYISSSFSETKSSCEEALEKSNEKDALVVVSPDVVSQQTCQKSKKSNCSVFNIFKINELENIREHCVSISTKTKVYIDFDIRYKKCERIKSE